MVSNNSNHQTGARAAFEVLTAALGQPEPTPGGGLRWAIPRGESGRKVIIDFTPSHAHQDTVWVFNPEASSVAAVFAYDVTTREGLASLRHEVGRLHLNARSFHTG
jgi:hypothetical protein